MTAVAVLGVTLATVILTVLVLTSSADLPDRMAETGVIVAGATLLLAVIAAVVALLAYAVSTGAPDLQLCIRFNHAHGNNLKFVADTLEDGSLKAKNFKQLHAEVLLRNNSSYPARNPAVIIRMTAMAFRRFELDVTPVGQVLPIVRGKPPGEWVVTGFSETNGITEVQWDGGPSYSIHGKSTRRLPDLELDNLHARPHWGAPVMAIELLADGYRKLVSIPVDFVVNEVSQFPQEKNSEWM